MRRTAPSARPRRRALADLEPLERRESTAAIQPTILEQLFLERLNDARAEIGASRPGDPAFQPLAFNAGSKTVAARFRDSWSVGRIKRELRRSVRLDERLSIVSLPSFVRTDSLPMPGDLIVLDRHGGGRPVGRAAEAARLTGASLASAARANKAYGKHTAASLAILPVARDRDGPLYAAVNLITFKPAGIRPIVTGSVIRDADGDGRYSPGEGLAGVTIAVAGQGSTTTFDSGGYNLLLSRGGKVVVTASGGALASPLRMTVTASLRLNARATFLAP